MADCYRPCNGALAACPLRPPPALPTISHPPGRCMNVLQSRNLVFAANCTIAALAAVWISGHWGLPNPGWAALTVFISSQPLAGASGAVTSRAFYRLAGTMVGGAVSLVLIPPLASTPELLVPALACWTA